LFLEVVIPPVESTVIWLLEGVPLDDVHSDGVLVTKDRTEGIICDKTTVGSPIQLLYLQSDVRRTLHAVFANVRKQTFRIGWF